MLALAGLAALLAPLPGCQSITGSPSTSQVRIIDASPDAGGIDVYEQGSILAYNLGLGTITSYVPITPGNYSIVVDAAGTRQQLAAQGGTFLNGAQYTVLVSNYSASLQETILKDQTQAAPSGQIALRIIDESTRAGAVDLYLIPTGSTILTVRPYLTNGHLRPEYRLHERSGRNLYAGCPCLPEAPLPPPVRPTIPAPR